MLREYIRYVPPDEQDPSGQASARSGRSLKSFLSFVDDREQGNKRKSMKQQKEVNNGIES